jgi:ribosome recycling factor
MSYESIVAETKDKMDKAIEFLKAEYRSIRTGRASTALVENIRVDYYGSQTPLKQLANLSTPESTVIMIKPFDANSVKDIEKAILSSSLGITPNSDGKLLRLNVPPLSGERRQQLAQTIKQIAEHSRVTIRNARRDANKHFDQEQKSKELTEDERDEGKKEVDELTKKYTDQVEELLKAKTTEVTET